MEKKKNDINSVLSELTNLQNIALEKMEFIQKRISENEQKIKKLQTGEKIKLEDIKNPYPSSDEMDEKLKDIKFKLVKALNENKIPPTIPTKGLSILLELSIEFEEYEISQQILNEINKRNNQ